MQTLQKDQTVATTAASGYGVCEQDLTIEVNSLVHPDTLLVEEAALTPVVRCCRFGYR